MRRAHQHRPSILVSEQLTAKILPLMPEHVSHFDPLETGFFKEGDDLSNWPSATDDLNDPTRVCKPRRRFARRWPLYGAAIGIACLLGVVLLGRARATAPRILALAAQVAVPVAPPVEVPVAAAVKPPAEIPVAAESVAELPTNSPAPAPVAERQAPSPSLPATGAVAANPQVDAFEVCRKAFDQHHAKEVLATCPKAMGSTPQSAELAVMLAKTEFEHGRARQALEWAKKAVALDADRADAYVYLGGAEQAAGRSAAAKAAYRRYLQLAPQGRYAADLRAVLANL
jgi:hypothetical protein